jgi:ATP citrate (pro-S)-lyase
MVPSVDTNVGPNGSQERNLSRSANDRIERFPPTPAVQHAADSFPAPKYELFNENTRALVYGLQPKAVQGMLDFDFICRRKTPSVAGIIYPFGGQFILKQYWGTKETLLPVYQKVEEVESAIVWPED